MNCSLASSPLRTLGRLGAALLAVGLFAAAPSLHAQVMTYTDEDSFFNNLASGAYFETFSSYSGTFKASGQSFSFGGDSFTLNDSGAGFTYTSNVGQEGSVYPVVQGAGQSLTIDFTSGNVTAFGGTFFVVSNDYVPTAGASITETLASGQSIMETSTGSYGTEPFAGFTSNVPITSVTITIPSTVDGGSVFLSLDNLYVGQSTYVSVPEPSTWAMSLGGMGLLLIVGRLARARSRVS